MTTKDDPFKKVWHLNYELLNAKKLRIVASGVGKDLFILASSCAKIQIYAKK
jgi:hypothetical protein